MIRDLLDYLGKNDERGRDAGDKDALRLAAAALLVEAASVDDRFEPAERSTIERVLTAHFGLAAEEARRLLLDGQRAREKSAQLYGFTRTINDRLEVPERVALIEMLWEVVYADGEIDPLEDTLLRRVGGLVDVPDRERGLARQRVLARLGRTPLSTETEP